MDFSILSGVNDMNSVKVEVIWEIVKGRIAPGTKVSNLSCVSRIEIMMKRLLLLACRNGCGMPTEDAYSSGHLVLSHLGFANVLLLRPLTLNHTLHQYMTPVPDLTFYRL